MEFTFGYRNRIRCITKILFPIPSMCSIESCPGIGERHHLTYDDPYNFIWLCKLHHRYEHTGCYTPLEFCNMRTIKHIKEYCTPNFAANPGMIERIQNRVGFKVLWSKLDILQTVMVFMACEAERGNTYADCVLAEMVLYIEDDYCPAR